MSERKEMEYFSKRIIEVLDTGFCLGLRYYIMNLGTHPTAYVEIPEKHWLYNIKDYDNMPINCHGGVTYLSDGLLLNEQGKETKGRFMGWDYGHCDDYNGCAAQTGFKFDGKKWTTEEIYQEVKDVCAQIIALENCSPADQLLEKAGYKKLTETDKEAIYYSYNRLLDETFSFFVIFAKISKLVFSKNEKGKVVGIDAKMLKAINKKAEELGWYD